MKIFNIVLTLILISASQLSVANTDSLIQQGNKYYNEGFYNDAISSYMQLVDGGYESSGLYYNMGNAYFKLNDMAHAIYYYEKAVKLEPNNEDIQFNLNVANSKIPDKIEELPLFFVKRWWNSIYNLFSANYWAYVAILVFAVTLTLAAFFFITRSPAVKRFSFWTGILFLLLSVVSFVFASQKYYYSKYSTEAIVFEPSLTVKSSPNKNSVDLYVIHEGTKVYVIDKVEDWFEIRIANGSIGWIPQNSVRKL